MNDNLLVICLSDNSRNILPGHQIKGQLILTVRNPAIATSISVTLLGETIVRSLKENHVLCAERNTVVNSTQKLLDREELLLNAVYKYPFEFELPVKCPGTVNCTTGTGNASKQQCEINYRIEAEVEVKPENLTDVCEPNRSNLKAVTSIRVLEQTSLQEFLMQLPYLTQSSHTEHNSKSQKSQTNSKVVSCKRGVMAYAISLNKIHFCPGEDLAVSVQVKNDTEARAAGLNCVLRKICDYQIQSSPEAQTKHVEEVVLEKSTALTAEPGTSAQTRISLKLPSDLPVTTSAIHNRRIRIRYLLTVYMQEPLLELGCTEVILLHAENLI